MSSHKNPSKNNPLAEAAQDWAPESEAQSESPSAESITSDNYVTFIADPLASPITAISEAQLDTEELELDEPLDFDVDESDKQLDKLGSAMQIEHERTVRELEAQAAAQAITDQADAAQELARQIAEDEALAREEKELAKNQESEIRANVLSLNEDGQPDLDDIQSCIEALLFVSDKPLSVRKLKEMIGPDFPEKLFRSAAESLMSRYQGPEHGIELVEVAGGIQFRTKPAKADVVRLLAKVQTHRLSRGAMESLAIVAYKQPVLKEDIDKVRGVDSSHFIRTLLEKKLIQISGRSELPGRPIVYTTTQDFLEIFGLSDLGALPPLRELEDMVPSLEQKANEDPKLRQMRELVSEMKADRERLAYNPDEDEKILQEIRERVKTIPVTTPYLEAQDQPDAET